MTSSAAPPPSLMWDAPANQGHARQRRTDTRSSIGHLTWPSMTRRHVSALAGFRSRAIQDFTEHLLCLAYWEMPNVAYTLRRPVTDS
jgi:hypothetical protein